MILRLITLLLSLAAAPTLLLYAASSAPQKKDSTVRRVLSYAELFAEMQVCKDTLAVGAYMNE